MDQEENVDLLVIFTLSLDEANHRPIGVFLRFAVCAVCCRSHVVVTLESGSE